MKVLILAGGKGERLRPITNGIPKPMVSMVGTPIIEIIISRLVSYGLKDIILTLGYLGDKIKEYIGDGNKLGANVTYFYENTPLGTAGAVKNAASALSDDFLVVDFLIGVLWICSLSIKAIDRWSWRNDICKVRNL